ncbi:MAG: UDP-3-O-(3-hydroxymyristoyl)glucosamine N-acyltransferase [Woeseiaceae bacterium]|nr:UDP-3-O-(3-hydroxymyristoyl)glucosamine N-acyltransferase [Woeseiaceae bacterium]
MPIRLGDLATRFQCDLDGDPDIEITHVASLGNAGPGALSFLSNARYKTQLTGTAAAAVIVRAADAADNPSASLISDDPYATYARMAAVVHPLPAVRPGVHPSAVVHERANVSASAEIGANVYVGENTTIGDNVFVGPGCVIGSDCEIGDDCRFIANVTLPRAVVIGKRGIFHPGVVIGADGFGNALTPEGWVRVPQLGGVRIGDDVEVGANTTIDCGALDDTVIENGVRIDNLCMIAHNVHIGEHTAMASMTGIAGSTTVGKRCMFAGQAGVVGHISICDDVVISGQGMVSKDITEPGVYASSFPIDKARDWNRRVARFRRIETLYDRVSKLEKGGE